MVYSYKFRIYPTQIQQRQIVKTFGCCRFVFNHFLAERQTQYKETGKTSTKYDQMKSLTVLKKELTWLKEADSNALQASIENLDTAFQNFFRRVKRGEKAGYPRFKSKHDHRQSYKCKRIKVLYNAVQLPKVGKVKCRISKQVKGRILSATVSRNPSGKYFVSLCCTEVEIEHLPKTGKEVGINLGLKYLAVTSEGVKFPNPKYLDKNLKRLAYLQRKLSRKTKGSKRYEKSRLAVARLHEHISNQRKDSLHKLSTKLVRENDIICFEDLSVTSVMGKSNFTRLIADASWGEFRRQLTYKAEWYGKKIVAVDRFFPSNQLCSECSAQWSDAKDPSVRKWICPNCGANHDRAINSAKNILSEGLRLMA